MSIMDNNISSLGGEIIQAPNEIGTPLEDAVYAPGPQERVDSCAIRSQQHILSMFGIDKTETELVEDAIAHYEYSDTVASGTMLEDVGNILERNGIETHRYEEATMAHLISELGQGHKIIVGVDAYEIAADTLEERIWEARQDVIAEIPNHALVVVNVDPNSFDVDVVDPADGSLHRIPADTFMDAWEDSNCFMVSTTQSPEEFLGDTVMTGNGLGNANIIENDINADDRIENLMIDVDCDGIADVMVQSFPGLVHVPSAQDFNPEMSQFVNTGDLF